MKSLTLIVCVVSLVVLAHALTEDEKTRIREIHAECQADPATHVDEDLLNKAYNGQQVSDHQLSVHILCMSKKQGFQKANGDVDKVALKKGLTSTISDQTKLNQAVDKCGVQKSTPEDTADHLLKCYHDYVGHVLHAHHHH